MVLSKKKTHLKILRDKIREVSNKEQEKCDVSDPSGGLCNKEQASKKINGNGTLIKQAKRAGRKKNELIDGSRLLTC